jgi:iron complex outermembrane receptor protein
MRSLTMISASVAALSFSGLMAPAHAADADVSAPAADAGQTIGLSEVIVTAQKRSENVQKVPVSISVLSAQGLADSHIQSLGDLENGGIPSLHVVPFASRRVRSASFSTFAASGFCRTPTSRRATRARVSMSTASISVAPRG